MVLSFIEVLKRAETGPPCEPHIWDRNHIALKAKETLKEHGLSGVYDPQVIINQDDGLADSLFQAAFEFAVETGFYCIDTQRIMKFTEDEIKEAIKEKIPSVTLGSGFDQYTVRHRKPEDPIPPMAFFGPFCLPVDEDIFIPLHQSVAQHRVVDGIIPASLDTAYGLEVKSGTPTETLAGYLEGKLLKEAVRRAGRPGLPLIGASTSTTQNGNLGGFGVPGSFETCDVPNVLAAAELKTSYAQLHKVAHILNIGAPTYSAHVSMIGGYAGSPVGSAMVTTAAVILQIIVHQASMVGGITLDARYSCNTSRQTLWGDSISAQAQTRNIPRVIEGDVSNIAGPFTDMILYEAAANCMTITASGATLLWGVRSSGGTVKNHASALESKFAAEIVKASAGLKRADLNEIVKVLVPKYEEKLKNPPIGVSFSECVNPKTLEPKADWLAKYHQVRGELIDLGLPL